MSPTTSAALYGEITISGLRLWHIALTLLAVLPLAAFFGFVTGSARRRRTLARGTEVEKVLSETSQGAFLALLGLLLAFTFGNALTASQSIKAAIVDEAAALGTAFLRADYLAEPGKTELQVAMLDYARTRVVPEGAPIVTREQLQAFLETTLGAQSRLWPLTLEATRDPTPPPIQAFVASAVNQVLDSHLYRVASLSLPIATFMQFVVLAATVTAVFLLANRTGMLGRSLTWRTFAFAFFMGLVLYTIVDIRRGNEGLIRVDDSALVATIFDMEQALAGRR